MNSIKKTLAVLLSAVMLVSALSAVSFSTFAFDNEGTCGENVTYSFDEKTGALVISGTGAMTNFKDERETPIIPIGGGSPTPSAPSSPWINSEIIKSVVIEEGVTNISVCSFYKCSQLKSVTISSSVTSINKRAFEDCSALSEVYYAGDIDSWNKITIKDNNDELKNANLLFGYNGGESTCETHNWVDGDYETEYDCTKENNIIVTCSVCGATIKKYVPAKEHTVVADKAVSPTCSKTGLTAGTHCSVCKKVLTPQTVVKATGKHAWNAGYITKQPTFYATGVKTYTCTASGCGAKTYQTVAKIASPAVSKLTGGKKQLKATWKSVWGIGGYQIQYSTNKSFKKGKKYSTTTVNVKGYKAKSKTIKKLKAKKTYYVRIRGYKTINGKTQYSKWSATKKIKTK